MSKWTWTYDRDRRAYDGQGPGGFTACVAKDDKGQRPWVAYCNGRSHTTCYRTMGEAKDACEEAVRAFRREAWS